MKVGSLVECIKAVHSPLVADVIKGETYTVRSMYKRPSSDMWQYHFEEFKNSICPVEEIEYGYAVRYFREVQPPMSLSFIEEMQIGEPITK